MIEQNMLNRYKNRRMYKPPPKDDYSSSYKKLIIVIVISFVFITGQFVGGKISGSISVISDAFHLVTDLIGFTVSFVFMWFAKKKPTPRMSFGYHRMQLIGALGNLFIIWALAIFLFYQATMRIIDKQFVKQPLVMLIVAAVGLPINIIMYFVLHHGGHSHGLMSQSCGEQFPMEAIQGDGKSSNMCSELICEDVQCLINNQYYEHCHKKQGQNVQIHKHKDKVIVEDGTVKRKVSIDQIQPKVNQEHKNCQHNHEGHTHNHDDHKHDHKHDHKKDDKKEEHMHSQNCNHSKNKIFNQQQQLKNNNVESLNNLKFNNHQGHDHHGHDHDGHNHQGHDHSGHEHHHQHESLSMKAAVLHALSDVIQSIGLIISSLIIFFAGSDMGKEVTEWNSVHLCDPITTYIFSVIVIVSTWPITKNCYQIIMQSTPSHIKTAQLVEQFQKVEGVVDIHDLHIWDLRPGKTILIAHVFSTKGSQTAVLKKLTDISRKSKIYHSTFQVEEVELKHNEEYILCDHDIH